MISGQAVVQYKENGVTKKVVIPHFSNWLKKNKCDGALFLDCVKQYAASGNW